MASFWEKSTRISSTPTTKFMNAPATRMRNFFQAGLLLNALGSLDFSSSPSMAQKPPMGKARREYTVSPFCREKSWGPMPMANSFTRTPRSLATMKCPNSWTAMSTPNIRIAIRM